MSIALAPFEAAGLRTAVDSKEPGPTDRVATYTGTRLSRRRYLGLAGATLVTGGAGWLSKWLGTPASNADRSFVRQVVWRDTLPTAEWDSGNHLLLHHDPFDGGTPADRWGRHGLIGAPHDMSQSDGRLVVENGGRGRSLETFTVPLDIDAPWVAVAATVSALSDSTRAAIGFANHGDAVMVGSGPAGPELGYRFDDQETTLGGQGEVPAPPYEMLAVLMGDRLAQLTRKPGGPWIYHGHLGWPSQRVETDLFDRSEWSRWDPAVGVETEGDGQLALDDFRVFHTLQFGIRDPTVVTYPDATPVVRDGEIYLTVTCGSVDHRGYQAVISMDIETYDITMRAALWAESVPGYLSNYVASHLMYDPDIEVYRQCWSGFGNGAREPYWNQKCWVSRTDADLLNGTHVVECERMHLPTGVSGRQHDPFVVWDEVATAWRCVHTSEAIHRITVSETTDETLTAGWTPVASYRDLVHQIEGGKLARIADELVLTYADQGSHNHMVIAAYPDPSADRRWFNVDVPPGDVAPHPSLVSVPTESGEPKLLLITMDGETVYGIGEPSHGALVIYEADGGS